MAMMSPEYRQFLSTLSRRYPLLYMAPRYEYNIVLEPGWRGLVEDMSEELHTELTSYPDAVRKLCRCECFGKRGGALWVFLRYTTVNLEKIIGKYSQKSRESCELCGHAGEIEIEGGYTLCQIHKKTIKM